MNRGVMLGSGLLLVMIVTFAGCETSKPVPPTPAPGGGHSAHGEDHPETYAEAVDQLKKVRDDIRDAFSASDPEKAHGPLHDVGHLLEDAQLLAAKTDMSDEDKAAVKQATNQLHECFKKVDDKIHGNEGADYKDVATEVDAAIDALVSKVPGGGA